MIELYKKYSIYIDNEEVEKKLNSFLDEAVQSLEKAKTLSFDAQNYFERLEPILYEKVKGLSVETLNLCYNYFNTTLNNDVKTKINNNIAQGISVDNSLDIKVNFVFYCVFIYSVHYISPKYLGKISVIRL